MAKYVKLKKVWKMLHGLGGCGAEPESWADGWDKAIDAAIGELYKLPAADVQKVKHGQWIQVDDNKCQCSNCGVITFIAVYPNGDKNFCPTCGAKMDGDENER